MPRERVGNDERLIQRLRRDHVELFKTGQRYRIVHESDCALSLPHMMTLEVHCDCSPVLVFGDKVFS